ncbi:MAG: YdcF family protein [Clostridia bacterium]|nr:YdcF family protein [Clostridia bacterium]
MREKESLTDASDGKPAEEKEHESKSRRLLKKIKSSKLAAVPWRSLGRWVWRFVRRRLLPVGCFLLCLLLVGFLMAWTLSSAVKDTTEDRIQTVEELLAGTKEFDCILILGCGVYSDGSLTPMLSDRVEVGVSLYQKGLCDRILMSGDHRDDSYNEVDPMKQTAISMGVASESIITDPYGLSTYDSIARTATVFGAKRVLIVTQEYHLPRALYLAERFGIDAYGVSADLRAYQGQMKYDVREIFARCKDVYYAETKPPVASDKQ